MISLFLSVLTSTTSMGFDFRYVLEILFVLMCLGLAAWFFMYKLKLPAPFPWLIMGVLILMALIVIWNLIQHV